MIIIIIIRHDLNDGMISMRHDLNDEHRKIVERLNEIMLEGKSSDGIMFKKVDKKTLKVPTDRVNDAIKYLKAKASQNEWFDWNCKCVGSVTNRIEEKWL